MREQEAKAAQVLQELGRHWQLVHCLQALCGSPNAEGVESEEYSHFDRV